MDCQTIVVNYTHPDRDAEALSTALELAYRHESDLLLLHSNGACCKESCQRNYLFSEEELIQQINKANGYGVPVSVKIVDEHSPLDEAISHLENHDLLVVGDSHADCFTNRVASALTAKLCYPSQIEPLAQAV